MSQAVLVHAPKQAGIRRFLRNCVAGSVASLCYFAIYLPMRHWLGASQTTADNIGLLAGAVVQFAGCRYFVFRARAGSLGRQAAGFTLAEVMTLLLNMLVLWLLRLLLPPAVGQHDALALASTFVVFVVFSYPVWHLVFRVRPSRPAV
ncbi:MAG: GtrA family protein [Planctomycetes bacterium]|nr:GtrA family protein [Planctomycetota bacterium]MCW8136883.1 GtrA family protein [Planctomycetota bacterium]